MSRMPTSAAAWEELPELSISRLARQGETGSVYHVVRVGNYVIQPGERTAQYDQFPRLPDGRPLLPIITIESEGGEQLFRLPSQLADWAVDVVSVAVMMANPFPAEVEFAILPTGRYYADVR